MVGDDWKGRRVLIIGAARQGTALARYLAQHGAEVRLNDRRTEEELSPAREVLADTAIEWALGGHPLDLLEDIDLVCPSGGVPLDLPLVAQARERNIPLSNDSQIFMQAVPSIVIGITGSAGKTTTTTLVGRMAQMAPSNDTLESRYQRTWVGGNIGSPLISSLDEMRADDLVVMELSSFQLELMKTSPHIAAVLNLTPNHLDRHGTMQAYTAAKANILLFQSSEDTAVLGRDDEGASGLTEVVKGRLYTFGRSGLDADAWGTYLRDQAVWLREADDDLEVLPIDEVQLRGEHNLLNVLAACAIASAAGLSPEAMRAGVQGFQGVPHRLEFVRRWRGADWYNDSIATAPERAIAAILSFQAPLVLLAGGRDKDLPWNEFAELVVERIDHLILFGEAAELIRVAVEAAPKGERPYSLTVCPGLQEAVDAAAQLVGAGDVVLLAPGGTSFDEFPDFEARGDKFKEWVLTL